MKDDKIKLSDLPPLHRAERFFILNRLSFSGSTESGGMSQGVSRWNLGCIDRLAKLGPAMSRVDRITCFDYAEVFECGGRKTFLYLDPPYDLGKGSNLYGKNGDRHRGFDHDRLSATLKNSNLSFSMTYNDSPEMRSRYDWANVEDFGLTYSMSKDKQGKELLITKSYQRKEN